MSGACITSVFWCRGAFVGLYIDLLDLHLLCNFFVREGLEVWMIAVKLFRVMVKRTIIITFLSARGSGGLWKLDTYP